MEQDDFNISMFIGDNEDAFDLLFSEHYDRLCKYAWSLVHEWYVAEDIVQDLFAEVWINRKKIKIKSSFSAYLHRSTYNSCLDYLKHQRVVGTYETASLGFTSVSSEDSLVLEELQSKIEKSISSLPEQCQKIFKLSRFDNLKYKEIATLLNISENSVDTQIRRALSKLKNDLKDYLITILIIFFKFF